MAASTTRIAGVLFGPPNQGSFNEAGARAYGDLSRAGIPLQVHWIQPRDPAGRAEALAAICNAGIDLLIAHGGQADGPVATIATRYPATQFAISQGSVSASNVACYEVLQEQSALLAGVLAACLTRSGTVAHLSGDRVRPGLKGRAAYVQGVHLVDPGIRVLTGFCGSQHDPDLAARCVDRYAAEGADLLFTMIDGGRPGTIDSCRRHRIAQIGNVLDWTARDPEVFIASAIADSGWGIRRAVHDRRAGRLACGQTVRVGLDMPEVVSLKMSDRVDPVTRGRVEAVRQAILSGSVEPIEHYGGAEYDLPRPASDAM